MAGDVVGDQLTSDRGREHLGAGGDGPYGGKDLAGWGVLEQEAAGTGLECGEDVLVEMERRQDGHRWRVGGGQDAPGRFQAVHARHPDVHQDDVGAQGGRRRAGLHTIGRLADHLDVVAAVEDRPEPEPDQLLVVNEQDADAHVGSTASTSKLPSSRGSARRWPPAALARSRSPMSP